MSSIGFRHRSGTALRMRSDQVWGLPGTEVFGYSDGDAAEEYIGRVLRQASDLSLRSPELGRQIRDWASEYHLSPVRSQLLAGFDIDPNLRVLEVGGGAGAISRYLGENGNEVTVVEGSQRRASLARARTRDLSNVTVINSAFQELQFDEMFDLVVCIGVLEYSAMYFADPQPFQVAMSTLAGFGNTLLLAIENQFGLKYFAGAPEDHLQRPFVGIEGYHTRPRGPQTMGLQALKDLIGASFPVQRWFYPFPDYKTPQMVISHDFLASGQAGELVAQASSRDHQVHHKRLFDERAATLALDDSGLLPNFANSFLVLASRDEPPLDFPQAAITYTAHRRPAYQVVSTVRENPPGWTVIKEPVNTPGPMLKLNSNSQEWLGKGSLLSLALEACHQPGSSVASVADRAQPWLSWLRNATDDGVVGGQFVDHLWQNAYCDSGTCRFIDQEWQWPTPIPTATLFTRAVFWFLHSCDRMHRPPQWSQRRTGKQVLRAFGEHTKIAIDLPGFVALESAFQEEVYGRPASGTRAFLKSYLNLPYRNRLVRTGRLVRDYRAQGEDFAARVGQRLRQPSR